MTRSKKPRNLPAKELFDTDSPYKHKVQEDRKKTAKRSSAGSGSNKSPSPIGIGGYIDDTLIQELEEFYDEH